MAANTDIEWTVVPGYAGATWNPLAGCSIASPGCHRCYAATMAARLEAMGQKKYAGTTKKVNGVAHWTGKINLDEASLSIPLKTKKPTAYFVNSMSDLFHEDVPDEFVDKVFAVMGMCRRHVFQVLTKRAERMRDYFARWTDCRLPKQRAERAARAATGLGSTMTLESAADVWSMFHPDKLPLPNIWLGTSVEDQQRADERIPLLLQTPAAVRFLSCEPLLGYIDLVKSGCPHHDSGICSHGMRHALPDWVITGCESGPRRRQWRFEWDMCIQHQCEKARVPFFRKQMIVAGKVSHDPAEWPEEMRVREFPEVRAVA